MNGLVERLREEAERNHRAATSALLLEAADRLVAMEAERAALIEMGERWQSFDDPRPSEHAAGYEQAKNGCGDELLEALSLSVGGLGKQGFTGRAVTVDSPATVETPIGNACTQGPWSVFRDSVSDRPLYIQSDARPAVVAEFAVSPEGGDARIMAAGPEMAQALRAAHHALTTSHNLHATDVSSDQLLFAFRAGEELGRLMWSIDHTAELAAIEAVLAKLPEAPR